jgi:hypothetical protein
MNGIGTWSARGWELVGQLQLLEGALRIVKGPDRVLTTLEQADKVTDSTGIIHTSNQVRPMGKGATGLATIIEYVEGHYDVQKTFYGEAYVWCHEHVVVECDCGERPVLSASETLCSCGADHTALVQKVLASQRVPHPWDAEYDEWRKKQDEYLSSEETYWLELSRID